MARMAVRWLVLVGLALILPSVVSAQRSGELVFGVLTAGFSDGYVVPIPAAQFVFFQGETIRLHIVVANTTSTPQIDTAGLPVTSAFRLVDRDRAGQSTQLAVSPMGSIGVAVTAKTVRWGSAVGIKPGTEVSWDATFIADGAPGMYRLVIELPDMRPSLPLRLNSGYVEYELRQIEPLRIAPSCYGAGWCSQSSMTIGTLNKQQPISSRFAHRAMRHT